MQVTDSVHLYRVNGRRKVEQVCSLRLNPSKAVNAKSQRGKGAVRHSRNHKDRIMAGQNHVAGTHANSRLTTRASRVTVPQSH